MIPWTFYYTKEDGEDFLIPSPVFPGTVLIGIYICTFCWIYPWLDWIFLLHFILAHNPFREVDTLAALASKSSTNSIQQIFIEKVPRTKLRDSSQGYKNETHTVYKKIIISVALKKKS